MVKVAPRGVHCTEATTTPPGLVPPRCLAVGQYGCFGMAQPSCAIWFRDKIIINKTAHHLPPSHTRGFSLFFSVPLAKKTLGTLGRRFMTSFNKLDCDSYWAHDKESSLRYMIESAASWTSKQGDM
jgi:hypothetical protein